MRETAVVLANGHLSSIYAKTSHGLIRGPSRYEILALVDACSAGEDAGRVLDGKARGIPVHASLNQALDSLERLPDKCIVGVATEGGVLPLDLRGDLLEAAKRGISLVNGLHQLLGDDAELAAAAAASGAEILDLRRPRSTAELAFWTARILDCSIPRVAVLGTDCALGKRTTCNLLQIGLRSQGKNCEVIYTGQTGWLQGHRHGFFFDATPNDFVSGELERAVLACAEQEKPDVMLLEGQSALRNPSGPCGSEFVVSAAAAGVILQHAPKRRFFVGYEEEQIAIRPLVEEIEMLRLLGSEVWALCIHEEGMAVGESQSHAKRMAAEYGLPTFLPMQGELDGLARLVQEKLAGERA